MSGDPRVPVAPADDVALAALEYVVVDVETTGGSPDRGHRVTEVGAIRIDRSGTVLDELSTLVNPERPIPRAITHLTHITQDMVASAPRFEEIVPAFQRVTAGAVFVAHNAPFDHRFLASELERTDFTGLRGRQLCTVRLARRTVPELRRRSLDALLYFFAIPCEARHRAMADARATAHLLVKLLDRAEDQGVDTWNALQELLIRKAPRPRR
ncbi:MAG: exonuclease domain-containing protein, partial [Gemmatimonadota bacterium]